MWLDVHCHYFTAESSPFKVNNGGLAGNDAVRVYPFDLSNRSHLANFQELV
jgi:hypothetical protein